MGDMSIYPAGDRVRKRRGGWCGLLFLLPVLASLTACMSFINPYIDADRRVPTYVETDPFPELREAAANAEELRQKALTYRDEHVVTRSLLRYGVFGAAAAGGVVAIYDGPSDLVLGLGLGAAGGYSFGELFVGADKITIYSAASRALRCVAAAADAVGATGKSLATPTAEGSDKDDSDAKDDPDAEKDPGGSYWQQDNLLGVLLEVLANEPAAEKAEAWKARAEYAAAVANLETFMALDRSFASAADQAAAMILEAMEQRLSAIQPNLDAVLRAAEGIGGLGAAYVKRVTPKEPVDTENTLKGMGIIEGMLEQKKIEKAKAVLPIVTAQVKQAAVKINEQITAETNRMGQVGTACVLNLPTAAKLSVSPTEVTLGEGQTVTLIASGGKLPLTSVWKDKAPSSKQIEVALSSGREIFLFGKTDLPAGELTLLVRDSLAVPGEVEIKITPASAKLTAEPVEVTVKADTSESIAVSGGTAGYSANWFFKEGETAPKIEIKVEGGAITLTGESGLPAGGEHSMLITDSATPPGAVLVKVKVKTE